ncbi:MAG: hypothetical protein ACRDBG_15910 [Waterburya sp.]
MIDQLKQFPYPAFVLDDKTNKILGWNSQAEFQFPSLKIGDVLPSKYTSSKSFVLGDTNWDSYYESGLLVFMPNIDTKEMIVAEKLRSNSVRLRVQERLIMTLTGLIGVYLALSIGAVVYKPDLKESEAFSANREIMALVMGAYNMILGSLFFTKDNKNSSEKN